MTPWNTATGAARKKVCRKCIRLSLTQESDRARKSLLPATGRPTATACPPKRNGNLQRAMAKNTPGIVGETIRLTAQHGGNVSDETAKTKFPGWEIFGGYSDGFVYTAPTGSYPPNDFGLYDMTGNVWEWCWDWYDENYCRANKNRKAAQGPSAGTDKVLRGGSWGSFRKIASAGNRFHNKPIPEMSASVFGWRRIDPRHTAVFYKEVNHHFIIKNQIHVIPSVQFKHKNGVPAIFLCPVSAFASDCTDGRKRTNFLSTSPHN